jgi:tRNA threonylcarbamoyladenosine biosynthesis protein TsaE
VREYEGVVPLVHVDVYRIDHLQELHDLGFDDLLGDDAVTVVEWGARVSAVLPADRLEITITADDTDDDTRRVELEGRGTSWAARRDALVAAAGPEA